MTTLKQLLPALILSFNCFGLGWFAGRLYEIDRVKPSGPDFIGSGKIASPAFSGTNIMPNWIPQSTNDLRIVPVPYYLTNQKVITGWSKPQSEWVTNDLNVLLVNTNWTYTNVIPRWSTNTLQDSNIVFLDEYKDIIASDPICQFVKRVNAEAVKDLMWNHNYTLAIYRAFVAECNNHIAELIKASKESKQ